jgi:dipeptidyl aminopeptidase/acylaminoacyl peptidase
MMGGSHGGINTLLAISRSNEITAAIDIVGPANLFNNTYKNLFREIINTKIVEEKINLMAGANIFGKIKEILKNKDEEAIKNAREELISRSPLYFVKYINCPVLMVYGGVDPLVPVEDAYSLEKEFKKYKKEFYLKIFPEQGHGFTPFAQMEIERIMDNFLKKYTEILEE